MKLVKRIADSVRNHFLELGDFSQNLTGACALASAELYRRLRKERIAAVICANDGHCWIEVSLLEGTYAVDVTASQFGFRDGVLVSAHDRVLEKIGRDLKHDCYAKSWDRDKVFKRVCDLRKWQKMNRWPEDQIV